MAKRKPTEQTAETKANLPQVESPSISPAGPASEPDGPSATPIVDTTPAPAAKPQFRWTPRHKRATLLAASVMLAATLGAAVGAVTTKSLAAAKPTVDVASLEERKAMQQSIAHLSKEVASLKVNLDAANKAAHSEMTKIAQRLVAAAAEVTGSITPPQTVPAAAPEPQLVTTPLPQPRPAPVQIAAAEPGRPAVVPDWTIRSARDGVALVQGHGELYQAVLGADLPGLGPVQTIKREEGRWIVVTPHGIIVSMRDRRYFE
jgi:hypothetical protein